MTTCAVMYHQFFGNILPPHLYPITQKGFELTVYVNKVGVNRSEISAGMDMPAHVYRYSPNCGKDIGGKMVLIDSFIRRKDMSEWIVFLHDKKSIHKSTGENWRHKLWSIVTPDFIENLLQIINVDSSIGMIGPASCECVWKKNDTDTSGMIRLVETLSDAYQVKKTPFSYVAGNMFWIKADLVRAFFTKWPPMDIRATLEKGNILDDDEATVTHAWERLFAQIVISSGMKSIFI